MSTHKDRSRRTNIGLRGTATERAGPTLVRWYRARRRVFPWRTERPDPYAVLVSEVMLQQTQAATVIPRYIKWMERFPTITDLADADLEEVLRYWQGLGYYSRARCLHETARKVRDHYHGRLPDDTKTLRQLPGIGIYTAGAVSSIAFGREAPALDVNATRVVSRYGALAPPIHTADLHAVWTGLSQNTSARDYCEALIELGATVCTATQPRCAECPIRRWCRGAATGSPEVYTPRPETPRTVDRIYVCLVAQVPYGVAVRRRDPDGIWGDLWTFPETLVESAEEPEKAARRLAQSLGAVMLTDLDYLGSLRYRVTRYRITLHSYQLQWTSAPKCEKDVESYVIRSWRDVMELPMPSPHARLRSLVSPPPTSHYIEG